MFPAAFDLAMVEYAAARIHQQCLDQDLPYGFSTPSQELTTQSNCMKLGRKLKATIKNTWLTTPAGTFKRCKTQNNGVLRLTSTGRKCPAGQGGISNLQSGDLCDFRGFLRRAIVRLTEAHGAYRWICGGVQVNYHTLADFRSHEGDALDGMRIRASAGAASFRGEEKLKACLEAARQQVANVFADISNDRTTVGTLRRPSVTCCTAAA